MASATEPQPVPVTSGEESSHIFPGLSTAEEVIVWAAIAVGILGVVAILLRLVMACVRKRTSKKEAVKTIQESDTSIVSVTGSTGKLLGGFHSASWPSLISSDWYESADRLNTPSTVSSISEGLDKSRPMEALLCMAVTTPVASVKSLPVPTTTPLMVHGKQSQANAIAAQDELNKKLSTMLPTPSFQRLESLDLNEVYMENWDRHVRSTSLHAPRNVPEGSSRF